MDTSSDAKRVCLITGGARGIGLATAKAMVQDGWRIALADRDAPALDAAKAELEADDTETIVLDVANVAETQNGIAALAARLGRLDGLVNNAGVFRAENLLDTTEEGFDRLLSVNVKGAYFVLQACARAMLSFGNGGVICNIASAAGRSGRPTQTVYGMTKAAMISLTKSAAIALAPQIRVTCVCPAAIETDMWTQTLSERRAVSGDKDIEALFARIPLGRSARVDELANVIAFLCSDKASFVTGGSVDVSGGLDMH